MPPDLALWAFLLLAFALGAFTQGLKKLIEESCPEIREHRATKIALFATPFVIGGMLALGIEPAALEAVGVSATVFGLAAGGAAVLIYNFARLWIRRERAR